MSKGKKFDAAEKHFLEKERKYRAEINKLILELKVAREEAKMWRETYETAKKSIEEYEEMIDKLTKYVGMPKEDVKMACEREKHTVELYYRLLAKWKP